MSEQMYIQVQSGFNKPHGQTKMVSVGHGHGFFSYESDIFGSKKPVLTEL